MSSSSSTSDSRRRFHVFLSFRGEDTRYGFTSHLHAALCHINILSFIDRRIEKGCRLQSEIDRAIEASRMSIVVLSPTYADSRWCLNELVKIMDCHRNNGQMVLPVFYHVDPSDVRHQTGAFGEAFQEFLRKHSATIVEDELSGWSRALTEATHFVGWHVTKHSDESDVIKKICNNVIKKLVTTPLLSITDFPVGLESRVQDAIQFLKGKPSAVHVLGIWGIGGSGKTTIAKVIYNRIHHEFVGKCFLANIREVWETTRGRIDLQEQLLSNVLKVKKVKVPDIEWGKVMIKESLCGTRALIVLDDVNDAEQLQALCGNRTWIGPGSLIVITTRDLRVLSVLNADHVHIMKEMDESESLELFSWHAFREKGPREDFIELSRNVVTYCGGLPLALEVLGSYLYKRTKQEWKSVLLKLEKIPNDRVQEKLKISFDGLRDHMEKDIFLDICCFFIGMDRAYVTEILDGCGLHAEIGIAVLIERSLIKVEKNNKLGMHDLLRAMGREIVREKSPKELGKRSRLWFHKDVLDVLTENTGTEAVEGLALELQGSGKACLSTKAFQKMNRMRLLQLNEVQLAGDFGYLPKQLRWVYWKGFPETYIPNNFYQRNLVAIDLRHSNLKVVWKEPQVLERLKILNLSHSMYLTKTPHFSQLPNLEKLILKNCPRLSEVHQSIGDLSNLLLINLKDCTSLRSLPRTIYKLKSLKTLIISGCSKIDKLGENMMQMESLATLIAKDTSIKQVPFSIVRLKSIGYISLCGYEGLSHDILPSLIWSWMSPIMNPLSCTHPSGGMSSSLVCMDIHTKNLSDLSSMLSSLSKLQSVWLQFHSEFQLTQDLRRILDHLYAVNVPKMETMSYALQISEHSLISLLIGMGSDCQVFNTLSNSISQGLTASGSGEFSLPGDNYPCWLTYTGEGHSVLFEVPQVSDCRMKGMTLCVVYSSPHENMATECLVTVLIVNYTKCLIQLYKGDTAISFSNEEWQGVVSNLRPRDKVEIFVAVGHSLTVKKTVVYLIYGESIDEKMEPSSEPKTPVTILSKLEKTVNLENFWFRKWKQLQMNHKPRSIP